MSIARYSRAFALPTVLISSVIMMTVLVVTLSTISGTQASLNQSIYERMARNAAESGAVHAAYCIEKNDFQLNTDIKPNMNCKGQAISGVSEYVASSSSARSSYTYRITDTGNLTKAVQIKGTASVLGKSSGAVVRSYDSALRQRVKYTVDPAADRASRRFWRLGYGDPIVDFGVSGSNTPVVSKGGDDKGIFEGITTVNSPTGEFLFWSNGLAIWDRTGNVMQNGDNLKGANSATQSVAAFPLNDARTQYAVVSNSGAGEVGPGAFYTSIIDMTLNGGKGAVTKKNTLITLHDPDAKYHGEGINAAPNSDGSAYWVYGSGNDGWMWGYLIDRSGTLKSAERKVRFDPDPCDGSYGAARYIDFSQDYSLMAVVRGTSCAASGIIQLFSTDLATGRLTSMKSWSTPQVAPVMQATGTAYSIAFSPSKKYIYVSLIYPSHLFRYNLTDLSSVKSTEEDFGTMTNTATSPSIRNSGGQVRLAPDGKIYIADKAWWSDRDNGGYLSYIDNPDASFANVGLHVDGLRLAPGTSSGYGLPQMVTIFAPKIQLY